MTRFQEVSLKTKYGSTGHRTRVEERLKRLGMNAEDGLSVHFSSVQIREYPVLMGDNPGGVTGPPLTIDWEHQSENDFPIDSYEKDHPHRRSGNEMQIPSFVRATMLKDAGYSRSEIALLQKPVNIARSQRKRTNATMSLDNLMFMTERARRKAIDVATLGSRKRRERKLLKPFVMPPENRNGDKRGDISRGSQTTVDTDASAEIR